MKQVLLSKGWVMYYECPSCKGGKRQFYNNPAYPGYEIRTREKTMTFSILLENKVISGPAWGYQLEDKLKQYVS